MTNRSFSCVLRRIRPAGSVTVAAIAFIILCLAASPAAAAPLTVSMMPSFSQNPNQGKAAINEPIQVWGRVFGGTGPYTTYSLDFGDGSPFKTGSIDDAGLLPQSMPQDGSLAIKAYIGEGHAYTTAGSKTVTLTVKDSAGATTSRSATVRIIASPTHADRVDMAIENGLRYLYLAQTVDGAAKSYWINNQQLWSGWCGDGADGDGGERAHTGK